MMTAIARAPKSILSLDQDHRQTELLWMKTPTKATLQTILERRLKNINPTLNHRATWTHSNAIALMMIRHGNTLLCYSAMVVPLKLVPVFKTLSFAQARPTTARDIQSNWATSRQLTETHLPPRKSNNQNTFSMKITTHKISRKMISHPNDSYMPARKMLLLKKRFVIIH